MILDEHDKCGTSCKSEKSGYKPKNLPYGKPLSDRPLRAALQDLFKIYCGKSDELAMLGSTQTNENFNHMVASKAPKRMQVCSNLILCTCVTSDLYLAKIHSYEANMIIMTGFMEVLKV